MRASEQTEMPAFERRVREFFGSRGADVDAQGVVFHVDQAATEVISLLESVALRPFELTHAGFVILMTLRIDEEWTVDSGQWTEGRQAGRTKPQMDADLNADERRGIEGGRRTEAEEGALRANSAQEGKRVLPFDSAQDKLSPQDERSGSSEQGDPSIPPATAGRQGEWGSEGLFPGSGGCSGVETRALAAAQRVTKGAIVGAVNTLERRGLVRRNRSEVDRRLVSVELTDEGRRVLDAVWDEWHALEVEVSGALSREEQVVLAGLLRRLEGRAREMRRNRREETGNRQAGG